MLRLILTIWLVSGVTGASYGQLDKGALKKQRSGYDMEFDTLSMKTILLLEQEYSRVKLDYPPDISFDTVHFELTYQKELIAIVPFSLRHTIADHRVNSTKFQLETLPDGRILLRIIKNMIFR